MRAWRGATWVAVGLGLDALARAIGEATIFLLRSTDDGGSWRDHLDLLRALDVASSVLGLVAGGLALAGVVQLIAVRPPGRRLGLNLALAGLAIGVLMSCVFLAINLAPESFDKLFTQAWWPWVALVGQLADPAAWLALVIVMVELARDGGRPIGPGGLALVGVSLLAALGLPLAYQFGLTFEDGALAWVIRGAMVLTPLPMAWLCARVGGLESEGSAPAVDQGVTSNLGLSAGIGTYRGAVVAQLILLICVAGFTILAVIARARDVLAILAVVGGIVGLIISFVQIAAALRIARETSEDGRVFGVLAVIAMGACLVLGVWAQVLTLSIMGVDQDSSYGALNAAAAAQEKLPALIDLGAFLGITATLPLIGAIHSGLRRAGATLVAGRSMVTAIVFAIGGTSGVGLRFWMEHQERGSLAEMFGLLAVVLGLTITALVIYLGYLGRARDALASGEEPLRAL